MRPCPREPRDLPGGLYRQSSGHRSCRWRDHHPGGPWHRRRPRHITGRGARHRAQGRRNRCHQTGLATFGKPFGLELYRGGRTTSSQKPLPSQTTVTGPAVPVPADARLGFHPDDTTPIPRPSRYYGRRQDLVTRDRAQGRRELEVRPSAGTSIIVPASPGLVPAQIDKSLLTIAEPKRLRDKAHLRFVASQPCLVCGRQPSDPHHLRFAQPERLGLKVSDEFTVPLCRGHHRQLHQAGNEVAWWENHQDQCQLARSPRRGCWENRDASSTENAECRACADRQWTRRSRDRPALQMTKRTQFYPVVLNEFSQAD